VRHRHAKSEAHMTGSDMATESKAFTLREHRDDMP
jgi:hypothetical protein